MFNLNGLFRLKKFARILRYYERKLRFLPAAYAAVGGLMLWRNLRLPKQQKKERKENDDEKFRHNQTHNIPPVAGESSEPKSIRKHKDVVENRG